MPTFQRVKLDGVREMIEAHLCPFCILRYCNVNDREIYLKSESEVLSYIAEELEVCSSELIIPNYICSTCYNVLREDYFGSFRLELMSIPLENENPRVTWFRTMLKRSDMKDITDYYIEISNLTSYMVRHYSMANYLITKYQYPNEITYNIWTTRDILKYQLENAISIILPSSSSSMDSLIRMRVGIVHLETNRDFLQIPGAYADEEDLEDISTIDTLSKSGKLDYSVLEEQKLRESTWFNTDLKRQRVVLKTKQNSPPSVEAMLQKLVYTQYPTSVICPPVSPSYMPTIDLNVVRKPIYVTGNYCKLRRGLSQTPWVVDGERKTEGSVEEYILQVFKSHFHADNYKFHSAGREDVDVRMLFDGRPFVIEMENSRVANLTALEYEAIQTEINQSTPEIQVAGLRRCSPDGFEVMKNAAENKRKLYVAVIYSENAITPEMIRPLENYHDLVINQKTPVRVLHRRSLLTREKTIHAMKVEFINSHHFLLELEASGGTYIKEFVHGDLGRTRPNVGEILNLDCDILQLDVKGVVGVVIN